MAGLEAAGEAGKWGLTVRYRLGEAWVGFKLRNRQWDGGCQGLGTVGGG